MKYNLHDESVREELKTKLKEAVDNAINTDSRIEYSWYKKTVQEIIKEIRDSYNDIFSIFCQSCVIVKINDKEDVIYNEEILFDDTVIVKSIYRTGDNVYIRLIDTTDDYWTDDIRLETIYALIEQYSDIFNTAKRKYLDLLKSRVYYQEIKLEQCKEEIVKAKKQLKEYEDAYGLS